MDNLTGKRPPRKQSGDDRSAVGRAFAILHCVAAAAPISSAEIVVHTGISKATVSRVIARLVRLDMLRQVPGTGRFMLTPAILDLSNGYLRSFDLRGVARKHLLELAEFAGASSHLCVRDRFDMVVIETVRPTSALVLSRLGVGGRLDLGSSAAGRAYLSAIPDPERTALLDALRMATGTRWPTVSNGINRSLEEMAKYGFCSAVGEWHPDISAAGVAVISPTEECYAITCGGLAHILTREQLVKHIGPKMVVCAEKIAKETGGRIVTPSLGQAITK
jgi:DNA-binding IclR family transcriptional regulator